ncbi:hypothetical protein CK219_02670 [Mesorhizobium sp. WSM4313]|nr:hypothetical protein CK219_02670 [Mesorhizobium sp. WSM4313]
MGLNLPHAWRDSAPLCPAGHLPHKGEISCVSHSPFSAWLYFNVGDWRKPVRRPISPQVGEMSGRTEGGAVPRPS